MHPEQERIPDNRKRSKRTFLEEGNGIANIAKKMAQGSRNILRREDYRQVKKMDRNQFEGFCKNLYMEGYRAGRDSVPGIDISQVKEAIAETKGIGENRLNSIMSSIEKKFQN